MKFSLPKILLILLCIFHVIVNVLWLTNNQAPIPWDQAGHARLALEFARLSDGTYLKHLNALEISSYYPPLTHIVMAAFLRVFGYSIFVASFPITIYLVFMIIGIFAVVKLLFKDEWVALFTATFFSFYLPVYENSRWLLLEIPLLTLLVWTWYWLIKSDYFNKWKETFYFSLFCSGLLLTKWTGAAFIVVPVAFVLIDRWRQGFQKKHLIHLFLAALFILLLTTPWYIVNIQRLIEIGKLASHGEPTDPQIFWSLDYFTFYFTRYLNFQLTLWPGIVAIFAAVLYGIQKKSPHKVLFYSFIFFGYSVFTIISNKNIRYTLPVLLPLAAMSAYELVFLWRKKNWVCSGVIFASLLYLIFQFYVLSFHLLPTYQQAWYFGPLGWIDYVNTGDIVVTYPKPNLAPNEKILKTILAQLDGSSTSIMVGIDQAYTNPASFDLLITLHNYRQLNVEAPYKTIQFGSETEIHDYIKRFGYVLIPTGDVGPDSVRHKKALEQIQNYVLNLHPDYFEVVGWYAVGYQDGEVIIFKTKL